MATMMAAALLALVLAVPKLPDHSQSPGPRESASDSDAQRLVGQLWSPDDLGRSSAKAGLVQIGHRAGPALVALITDLLNHPDRRCYATGKEREGEEYYQDAVGHAEMAKFVIYWRLIFDCIDILGITQYGEGAPVIVRVLEEFEPYDAFETNGPAHLALVNIGEAAVLPLIDAINNASVISASISAASDHSRGVALARIGSRLSTGGPDLADRIRQRAASALGDIGDQRAVPVLESLLKPGQPFERGNVYVEGALGSLRSRHPSR